MGVELLALFAAVAFGASSVLHKKGLETSSPMAAAVVSTVFTALVLLVDILATLPLRRFASPGLPYFILAGLFAPGTARLVSFHGFQRLGVSISVMVMAGAPLWASLVSVLLFAERLTPAIGAGTLAIVSGTIIISGTRGGPRAWRRLSLLFPLAAGFFYGMRDVAARQGLPIDQAPLIAGFVTAVVSLVVMAAWTLWRRAPGMLRCTGRGFLYYTVAGITGGISYLGMFRAFAGGEVVIVSPLVSTHPVFAVVLARLVLGRSEQLGPRSLLGGLAILLGAVLIAALRG
ncbi:MAG: DMT family transporter [Candidatus Tectomicrobia bacterium]|nr:DMT family transporter [Candidatus Tectomicrobia bacterium]